MMGESEWFQFLADLQEELAKRMERDNKEPANTDTNEHTIITRAITFNFSLPANFKRAASERFRDGGEVRENNDQHTLQWLAYNYYRK